MLFYLVLELVAVGFAFVYAVRARSVAVVVLLSMIVYGAAAVLLAAVPPHVQLPGAAVLAGHWAIYPVVSIGLAAAGTWIGFRRSAGEWEGTAAHRAAQRVGLACLAVMLVHLAAFVVMGAGALLVARDSF